MARSERRTTIVTYRRTGNRLSFEMRSYFKASTFRPSHGTLSSSRRSRSRLAFRDLSKPFLSSRTRAANDSSVDRIIAIRSRSILEPKGEGERACVTAQVSFPTFLRTFRARARGRKRRSRNFFIVVRQVFIESNVMRGASGMPN